jgi:predicted transcriptional regulator
VAERAGTSQQWVTRAERGQVDLRLGLRLLEDDADVAELARRRAFRGGRGGGRIRA